MPHLQHLEGANKDFTYFLTYPSCKVDLAISVSLAAAPITLARSNRLTSNFDCDNIFSVILQSQRWLMSDLPSGTNPRNMSIF